MQGFIQFFQGAVLIVYYRSGIIDRLPLSIHGFYFFYYSCHLFILNISRAGYAQAMLVHMIGPIIFGIINIILKHRQLIHRHPERS